MNASKIVRWENGCPNHTTAAKFQIESHKLKPVLEVIQLGKHCVILGRGDSIGKPLAVMFMNVGATVTVCNSHTTDLKAITTQADILVSTIRRPGVITADMLHPGAVVVDLGDNMEEVGQVAGCVSPAVGGVDVITPAVLIQNTVLACEMYSQK